MMSQKGGGAVIRKTFSEGEGAKAASFRQSIRQRKIILMCGCGSTNHLTGHSI